MTTFIQPFHLLVIALAGWLNRDQQAVIDYLIANDSDVCSIFTIVKRLDNTRSIYFDIRLS